MKEEKEIDIANKIQSLREEIARHERAYYQLNAPTISDIEFDFMMKELEYLESQYPQYKQDNSPTNKVGSDLSVTGFEQVTHRYPMLSLSNTYSAEEIVQWYDRAYKAIGHDFEVVCELKFDGTSISLWYQNGVLSKAVTRGDGTHGDDVTANVRTINAVPLRLKGDYPNDVELRGEILLPYSEFDRLNAEKEANGEQLFANPRNAAAGTIKLLDSKIVAQRKLTNYVYYMLGEEMPSSSHYQNMQIAKQWGLNVSEHIKKCQSLQEVLDFINYWDEERHNLDVATDGMVLKIDDLNLQRELGYTAKSPRWAIAYKFQAEKALTRLESVTYQVGRTGVVTPVANLAEVKLSGTMVKRATLHNADFMASLDLHHGDMVYVEKGGEIIPKVTSVDLTKRENDAQPILFTDICPECGTKLIRIDGEAAHYCPNPNCAPQICGKIEHFVSRKAMNIDGLGEETIALLYRENLVHSIADLYRLQVSDLAVLERLGNKSASNIIKSIGESRNVPFERVLFALGIRYVGETVSKKLVSKFLSIENLRQATFEELTSVDDIGESIANSILEYFRNEENNRLIDKLIQAGLQFISTKENKQISNVLEGLTFVISGVFAQHSRQEYKDMIEAYGGKNISSISAKTSYILAGENMGPAKLQKAEQLGIKIIDEEQFLKMIQQ